MDKYTNDVIEAVTREYLKGVLMTPEADKSLSNNRIALFKKQADRLLRMELFVYAVKKVVAQTKDILLLQTNSQEEVLINRGALLGLRALEQEIRGWTAGGKAPKDNDEEEDNNP